MASDTKQTPPKGESTNLSDLKMVLKFFGFDTAVALPQKEEKKKKQIEKDSQ